MELTNFEKRLLLVSMRFLYKSGPHFISMLWDGDSPPRMKDWEVCKIRMKKLYKKIKDTIDDDIISKLETGRDSSSN